MKHPQKGLFARLLGKSETPIIVFTLLIYGAFSVMAPNFNTFDNVSVIAQQITINGIVALGMTIVIMIGGMDLSVGSLLSLCGVLAGMMDNAGLPVALTVLLTLALGTALGALNGLLIVKLHIPDIIVTLATMNIFRGVAVMITRSQWITDFSEGFLRIGASKGGLFSVPILLYAAVAVVFAVCLRWLPFGRLLYAVGGNREAAGLMGLNVASAKTARLCCERLSSGAGRAFVYLNVRQHPGGHCGYKPSVPDHGLSSDRRRQHFRRRRQRTGHCVRHHSSGNDQKRAGADTRLRILAGFHHRRCHSSGTACEPYPTAQERKVLIWHSMQHPVKVCFAL